MSLTRDAVLFVDWLNLSIKLKEHGREFGPSVARSLLSISRREADARGVHLARAHFVAEDFSPAVLRVVEQDLIAQAHKTRTAKEQADLMLAVLAMDHLHDPVGTPGLFVIATGDQDFIPLVERLIDAQAEVVLIAGALGDLAPEYRSIVAQHNVQLLGLIERENVPLLQRSSSADERTTAIAALLKLLHDGGPLGGDQSRNVQRLQNWRISSEVGTVEERLQGWIQEFCSSEMRRVAHPAKRNTGNQPGVRRRTFLDFKKSVVAAAVADMDWILRRCDPLARPASRGSLGVGRFAHDDGSRVEAAVSALKTVGWLQERPSGGLESTFPWKVDGLLEPVSRLLAVVQASAYQNRVEGVDRDQVWKGLASVPLGADASRKGGTAAAELIDFGKRLGVVDVYPSEEDGYVLGVVPGHPLVLTLSSRVRVLRSVMPQGEWVPEHAILDAIREVEPDNPEPLFGFDHKDRRASLRPLTRANVVARKTVGGGALLRLRDTAWVHAV